MVWAEISWRGKTEVRFVSGNMDATAYATMAEGTLETFIHDYCQEGLIFQQDGATAHRAKTTPDYIFDIEVPVLPWAPCPPDMKVIEKCCGHFK